jgi:hypothetical protein
MLGHSLPDGCWRPYDLHPNALKQHEDGCCVQMVHDCYMVSKMPSGAAKRAGAKRTWAFGATLDEIEKEFDSIFEELGHVNGDFPFENNWREDGATANMVIRYAERHDIKCYVHHRGSKLQAFLPKNSNCHTPTINFSIFGHHAYWYAPELSEDGQRGDASTANMAIAKIVPGREQPEKIYDEFSDEGISELVATVRAPAYTTWGSMEDLCIPHYGDWDTLFDDFRYNAPEGTKDSSVHREAHNKKSVYVCNYPNKGS